MVVPSTVFNVVNIGILALQGAVEPHVEKLQSLGVGTTLVRRSSDLKNLSGLILPGGESTTMIHLLKLNQLWNPLADFIRTHPTWGICAGAILLASEVTHPEQESLKSIDVAIERNAFGRQTESFIAKLEATEHWKKSSVVEGIFIRAPRIRRLGPSVTSLLTYGEEPVLVESGNILLGTFHPELTNSPIVHQYFIERCKAFN